MVPLHLSSYDTNGLVPFKERYSPKKDLNIGNYFTIYYYSFKINYKIENNTILSSCEPCYDFQ